MPELHALSCRGSQVHSVQLEGTVQIWSTLLLLTGPRACQAYNPPSSYWCTNTAHAGRLPAGMLPGHPARGHESCQPYKQTLPQGQILPPRSCFQTLPQMPVTHDYPGLKLLLATLARTLQSVG